jgi:pyridoxal phosphate enzyme (YggS family)
MTGTIAERYGRVRERIADAARRSGRDPGEIRLVTVSKTQPAEAILEAIEAGATDMGENRAQELKQKVAVLGNRASWHFIGHLQTNKVRHVAGAAVLIHSVDRYGVAEAIATRSHWMGAEQQVLIEVNVSGEPTKHGVTPLELPAFAESIAALEGLSVRGLMTMAPYSDEAEESRPYFEELRELGLRVNDIVPGATELSMGMTRDFEVGVEEGATIVRVGEAIFGPRL